MIGKNLSEITVDDVNILINNAVSEGKTIDFKEFFSLDNDKEKGEFLADISSFANTNGGDLIFGIREEGGIAKEVKPFEITDIDKIYQKIQNLVHDGLNPRIKIDIQAVKIESDKYILIVRTARSWQAPHRVIFTKNSETKRNFYTRTSVGKQPLDVGELRTAFLLTDTLTQKIKDFHTNRITDIIIGNTAMPLNDSGKMILHIIPLKKVWIWKMFYRNTGIIYIQLVLMR